MFCLIFSSRMWLPCIRRSLCWKLFLDLCIDIFQCPLHVLLYFFIEDKEKKKAALNDRTRVPCFACIACVACFFDVSFFIPGSERVGQRSRQAEEGFLFFECL